MGTLTRRPIGTYTMIEFFWWWFILALVFTVGLWLLYSFVGMLGYGTSGRRLKFASPLYYGSGGYGSSGGGYGRSMGGRGRADSTGFILESPY